MARLPNKRDPEAARLRETRLALAKALRHAFPWLVSREGLPGLRNKGGQRRPRGARRGACTQS